MLLLTKIQTLTLDSIIEEQRIQNIDLIKIDVQGAEHLVLQGGVETLKRTKLVFIEFSYKPLYEKSSTFFDLYNIFYENNFMLVSTSNGYASPSGELLQGDALFVNKAFETVWKWHEFLISRENYWHIFVTDKILSIVNYW